MEVTDKPANDLEYQIFGGEDSDLSSISSDDEAPKAQKQKSKRPASPAARSESPESESEPEDDDEDNEASRPRTGDAADYVAPTADAPVASISSMLPKIKKQKRSAANEDDAGRPKKRQKKPSAAERRAASPEPELDLTPEEARKKALEDRLDALLKKPKAKKKRRAADEEDLGQAAEEELVLKLRQDMLGAAQADVDASSMRKPAFNKLNMLSIVVSTMQKTHLEGVALDNGILAAFKEWLEPLSDRSLPPLNILRAVFAILLGMRSIDTSLLKESNIGRIVMFYSRCPRVDLQIRRLADQLITNWMRPLLRRSATWRDKVVQRADRAATEAAREERDAARRRQQSQSLRPGMQDSANTRRHARIPQAISATYTVAPQHKTDRAVAGSNEASKEAHERFKAFNRQLKAGKAAARKL